jgi:hypothetical protein
VLALLGGVRKRVGGADGIPVRGDIHLLMCGDPGLGKSQLLQARPCQMPLAPSLMTPWCIATGAPKFSVTGIALPTDPKTAGETDMDGHDGMLKPSTVTARQLTLRCQEGMNRA